MGRFRGETCRELIGRAVGDTSMSQGKPEFARKPAGVGAWDRFSITDPREPTPLHPDLSSRTERHLHLSEAARLWNFAAAARGDSSRSHVQGSVVWGGGFPTGEEKDGGQALK